MDLLQRSLAPEGGKTRRLYLLLRDEIANGTYNDGEALPGELRLAERYSVSRVTVRRALDSLAADGVIEKRAGSGNIVRSAPAKTIAAEFAVPGLVELERRTDARLLHFSYGPATPRIADALQIPRDGVVQQAVRVRTLDDEPLSHLTTHVPEAIARTYSEAELATTPLFRLLERSGVRIEGASQSVTATLAAPDVAAALQVELGSALLALTRTVTGAGGQPVEHLDALYRPDRFRLAMRFSRVESDGEGAWQPLIGEPS